MSRRRGFQSGIFLSSGQVTGAIVGVLVVAGILVILAYSVGLANGSPSEQVCPNKGMSDLQTWPVSKLDNPTLEFLRACGYGNAEPIPERPNPVAPSLAPFPADPPDPAVTP